MRSRFLPNPLLAGALLLLVLAGCGTIEDPRATFRSLAPQPSRNIVPDSPGALLDAFAHAWNNRDPAEYSELLTQDFQFAFSPSDSAGSAFPGHCFDEEAELETARHLFVTGTANNPPAMKILLTFDRTFFMEPDSRPGKTFPWHQQVKRNVVLSIDTGDQNFRITGASLFFVVRGDSAAIPPDLVARGVRPDPNRWWIERWEDETLGTPSLSFGDVPTPTRSTTWGSVKILYR